MRGDFENEYVTGFLNSFWEIPAGLQMDTENSGGFECVRLEAGISQIELQKSNKIPSRRDIFSIDLAISKEKSKRKKSAIAE
jgi:hypothetical protein